MPRAARAWVWALLCCLLPGWLPAIAQPPRHTPYHTVTRWTMEDGLPHNLVHAVAQGADGLIWVGTWEGVARFNGRDFTVYDRQNTPGVELGGVFVVVRDGAAMLFGTAFDGVYRYQDGNWQQLGGAPARHLAVSALLRGADGALWVGTPQTLYRIEPDGRLLDIGRQAGLPRARITALQADAGGDLWIGTDVGLYRLPAAGGAAAAWGRAHGMQAASVRRLASDRDGGLLVAGDDGVWWWGRGGGLQRFRQGQRVDALLLDRRGQLWMSMPTGTLVVHNPADARDEQIAVSGVASPALLEDAEGLIWVGSTHGLFRIAEGAAYGVTQADGLASDYVRSVLQTADGTVWVGSAVGLDRWRDGRISRVALQPGVDGRVPEQSVLSLADAGDGGVWAGTYSQGVVRLDAQGLVRLRIGMADGLPSSSVRVVLPDGEDLWIGTTGGLLRWRQGTLRRYTAADGVPDGSVQALYRDAQGVVWSGTDRGMTALSPDGSTRAWLGEQDFPGQNAFDFLRDANGDLWIASDRGLLRLRAGRFRVYDHRVGLPRDKVFRVIDDGRGYLWLSSNHGVFRIARSDFDQIDAGTRDQLSVEVVDRSDGMPGNQGNGSSAPAGWLTHAGQLLFPTAAGLGVIDPARVGTLQGHRVPIVFERLLVDGMVQPLSGPHRFGADTRRIAIGYAGLNFRRPDKVRYRYRLEGFDPEWVDADGATEAVYTNLPPGRFRFRVQAMSLPVDWRQTALLGESSLALALAPPWWRRGEVIALGLLLLAGLVYAFYLWRTASYRRRQRQLNTVIDRRTRELRDKNLALQQASQERETLVRQLEYRASHDVLTALPNRREAERVVQQWFDEARAGGAPLALALMDIDHFKRINDTYGHEVGDAVLCAVAEVLSEHAQGRCFAARHGGEEFLLAATGRDAAQAHTLFEGMRQRLATIAIDVDGGSVHCTASIGMAMSEEAPTRRELLALADRRLYQAKRLGRDRLVG
ncbi:MULTISPECIES: ligand-binding sensor domain-containing diguanylate cyclase [Xanthomonas]|uniref:diguanylate cyclase n=1 Tax=Xanthomonas cucurbitae TaxID=56453 RepID=A0A2S7DUX7_9XANT|nr:ligand-binding sensor domain-containing diguanylate cyclase [Xanthomonas cucurbitae]PPU77647.1 GGDEF domain-containing protein [Xanthomonas cucurbitae]QHG88132.1 GGDEF domain-containing protein [Xanthomonas cucurbitae]WDM66993.1 diguanylate cyclase [Xanthomonas cucurbitae]WDM70871.1 diguanylate cyclase [Xanthomonas cucurbitae]WDM74696.1 diguanylate cyclase [Xanthomonas cucurbitae]